MRAETAGCSKKDIQTEMQRVLASASFKASGRNRRFLRYIVEETLAGRAERLKGYSIALEVFQRPDSFDANRDPVVRMEASKLRCALEHFYLTDGGGPAALRIVIPKGGYVPDFHSGAQASTVDTAPAELASPVPGFAVEEFARTADGSYSDPNVGFTYSVMIALHDVGQQVFYRPVSPQPAPLPPAAYLLGGDIGLSGTSLRVTAVLREPSTRRLVWGWTDQLEVQTRPLLTMYGEMATELARVLHAFAGGEPAYTRPRRNG